MSSKALIIEDDSNYADMLCSVLKRLGHIGTVVTNKQDALYRLDEEYLDFDFVLLDLRLPAHKDALQPLPHVGFEILTHIRKCFDPQKLKVIVMTAHEETSQTGIRAMHAGADDYFSKNDSTVNPEDKIGAIVNALQEISDRSCKSENSRALGSGRTHKIEFLSNTVLINSIRIEKPIWIDLLQLLRRLTADSSGGMTAKEIAKELPGRVSEAAIRQRFSQLKKHLCEQHKARDLGDVDPDEIIKNPMGQKGYEFNKEFCVFVFSS